LDTAEIEGLLGGPPRLAFDDIVNHPRLPEARRVFIDRFLEVYGGDPFLVRLLIESGRISLFLIAAVLDAAHDPARRETWFTVGRLKQMTTLFGMSSGRHVDELVARLCAVGFMESKPSEGDRRVRILKPTEKMLAHDRDWIAAHYAPLTVLYPQHDYGLVMRRDPTFHYLYRRVCVPLLPIAAKLMVAVPEMMVFLNRAGGFMVAAALMQAAMAQGQPHAAVPYGDVGDRFGLSRTHVRKLLVAAEEAGLVKLHERGGHRVEILPRLWDCGDRGMAGGLYLHDIAYVAATTQPVAATLLRSGMEFLTA
jgi:hypothetical protein